LTLVRSVQNAPDRKTGDDILKRSLSRVAAGLVSTMEIEAIRGRIMALASLPERPQLRGNDLLAALAIFLIVVASTFPVVLPFVIFDDVGLAKSVSRDVALVMLFFWWSRARSLRGLRELEGWFSDDRYRLRTSDGDSGARRIRSDGVWIAPSQNVRIRMKSTRTEY
jgi:hypothetical protein